MATMTPREQIEWIRDDVGRLVAELLELPAVVYLVAVADHNALVDSTRSASGAKPHTNDGRLWLCVGTRSVEVIPDSDKPAGLAPFRCYRCPCGTLFLYDSSRSGRCVVCQMERVVSEVHKISTPVGDIALRADPTLKPDEFRIETDPTEEFARRALADSVSRDTSAVFDFNSVLDEHYPRYENGRHYIPAPPKVDWSKLTKTRKSEAPREWVKPVQFADPGAGAFDYTAAFRGVERFESPERLSGAKNHRIVKVDYGRPDGFAQSKIDEIKAMLTAPVKGKR